ncbi:MAG: cation transporter [Xanthomonadaceae bacterium]|nr:cation transporter [Xanthomonadaceae bacterium]
MGAGHGKHEHDDSDHGGVLGFTLWITLAFGVLELITSYWSNSLALFSDAAHMFSDSAGILLAYVALHLSRKRKDERFEILGGLLGGILVTGMSLLILYKSVIRLSHPEHVHAQTMVWVGAVGLLVNLLCIWKLWDHREDNINMRAAFLHVMGDALGSVGAMLAGILMGLYGWDLADPVFSIVFTAYVLFGGMRVIRDAFLEIKHSS